MGHNWVLVWSHHRPDSSADELKMTTHATLEEILKDAMEQYEKDMKETARKFIDKCSSGA